MKIKKLALVFLIVLSSASITHVSAINPMGKNLQDCYSGVQSRYNDALSSCTWIPILSQICRYGAALERERARELCRIFWTDYA
jgi:hypothetical protein